LRFLEGDVEVGGGGFPTDEDTKEAPDAAHADVVEEATSWLRSRKMD
jgi:hypothetical protein